ncbi:histidine phosphotransferase family protein [Yoonia litorea]|uniref:Histidine phosphotransferase ChpT n=1 Tax=Yoonia litorea TaxID=1123755 RepID=A0A1I6M659_9RHOB|nr:histidine phosphotransferase family protein [Yoonia litorea]SFS11098.1 histidine phosphotransferase ChpT [Yoonia litorea]
MQPDLATLVGSRICHDLISPIGAISNGVELLGLMDGAASAEMDLIRQSVESAAARIKFFRICYGATKSQQSISQAEIETILRAVSGGGRLDYHWQAQGDQPRDLMRCIFLILQAIETALPLGGSIRITETDGDWQLMATGERLSVDENLWRTISDRSPLFGHNAAQVQFALLNPLLVRAERQLSWEQHGEVLTVRL